MMIKKGLITLIVGYILVICCLMESKILLNNEVYLPFVKVIVALLIGIFVYFLYQNEYKKSIFIYLSFIIVIMFYREKVDVNVSFKMYLWQWLKIIFKNRSVLFSILGNIFLFFPLTLLILRVDERCFLVMIILFIMVLVLEILQFFTKRGVFDIIDIVLNYFGIILGAVIYKAFGKKREEENGTFI